MNKAIIISELNTLLETINEQFVIIKPGEGYIPQFEFDLLSENVRKLHEKLQLLSRLNLSEEVPGSPARQEKKTPPAEETPVQPPPKTADREPVSFRVVSKKQASPASRKKPARQEPELFPQEDSTFNIRLREARDKSLGPKPSASRPGHLKGLIGINDKFLFINELFSGNLREYNETVETLNGFINLNQAYDYLDMMRRKNFWNPGSEPFNKLRSVVEQYMGMK